jgi:hypothetical protein
MRITNEIEQSNKLIEQFLSNKDSLSYANIGLENEYLGWVGDLNIKDKQNRPLGLDLTQNNDRFLLFVLAVVWSRPGQWENSVYFISYLKVSNKTEPAYWIENTNYIQEQRQRLNSASEIINNVIGITPRKKVSFRRDIFESIHILSLKWQEISTQLEKSDKEQDFESFVSFMRTINGLGFGKNKMLIKIPLILREFRCQNIYSIPGELCCVPDSRVMKSAESLGISLPRPYDDYSLMKSSKKMYHLFKDLYDLPLFAFPDLNNTSII